MRGRISALCAVVVALGLAGAGPAGAGPAGVADESTPANLATDFHAVLRGQNIKYGLNMLGWGRCAQPANLNAVNMSGPATSKSDVWLTNLSGERGGSMTLQADVGIWRNDNRKGGGVAWSWDESTQTGLAVFILDSKVNDSIKLAKIEGGRAQTLAELKMGDALPIHATPDDVVRTGIRHIDPIWFRLVVDVTSNGTSFSVAASVFAHATRMNPSTPLAEQLGKTLRYGPVGFADKGVAPTGEIGLAGHAVNTSAAVSFASFLTTTGPPEAAPAVPGTRSSGVDDPVPAPGPDLEVTSSSATVGESGSVRLKFTVKNSGAAAAPAGFTTATYLSADRALDAGDTLFYQSVRERPSSAGTSFSVAKYLKPFVMNAGSYYVITKVDTGKSVRETSEANNVRVAGPVDFGANCPA